MEIHHLDAKTIHSAFLNACDAIISNRENLNAINLFPVADGDTGDNMSATALSVITHSTTQTTLNETLKSLADSALIGARGNSGMIFSQFFNGLTEIELTSEQIDTITFSRLITQASQSVRSAILHPVEGTIITVIDAWSASISKVAQDFICFKKLIKHTLSEVNQALQSTANTLPVLKDAHVVDAGALGFYHFINGFSDYLINPRAITHNHHHEDCLKANHELPDKGCPPEQRYCTEITLSGESIDRTSIANQLEQFGDSVVSSGNASLCRFHVHCTQPAAVFESLFHAGTITHAKAQDMLRQFQMIHQRKYPIALVTDSSADIPQSVLDENQIHIIQLNMHLDGHNLLDRICVNQDTFYDHLSNLKTYPKTSFPSPALLEEQVVHLSNQYEQVLILPISQGLSGTHDAIIKVTEHLNNVHVVNSCQTSGGLGLLVHFAAQLIAAGLPLEEIKKELILKIPKIEMVVYVERFDSLIRSGRIGRISGRIAQLAQIKPIIRLDSSGKAALFDKAFSETKALTKLIRHVDSLREHQSLESYGLVHAGVSEKAKSFAQLTTEALGQPPAFIESVSTALGLHAGKGSVAVATMMK
ncbi:DegV family protein [Legionella bononiensis]|uniref:DegV family EDD domain-containing protein n=1 Tax=Legionella bononiensis TaxID=2793102 RepID=A0ABS1WG22_9GAMM|nr:DegV family protein [Legionella bononiensis]MBL7481677.1 DegV family EDD domain-containing protein [Legionella bononiensis]MBL7528225.1 DegV family EDD domain-containing protein [Legionella bononiensis]MBL7562700.1 DegV family EDD domain-containing protein [Legionella bononiensis]